MEEKVVVVEHVTKVIKGKTILEDISLEIPSSKIYGLCGPNGSGKSMLLRVISGLVFPIEGRVLVFGKEIGHDVEFPEKTGILIEKPGFLTYLNGMRNLELLASIRNEVGREQIAQTLEVVGLDPYDKRPVRAYSTGMIQRLGLAQALMENPQLLLMDEPTSNLDREGIKAIHKILRNLKGKGVTILITSPNMEELKHICDAVFWIEHGHLEKEPLESIFAE